MYRDEAQNLIMSDVARITLELNADGAGEVIHIRSLFGEEKEISGRIASIDFLHHIVILEREDP